MYLNTAIKNRLLLDKNHTLHDMKKYSIILFLSFSIFACQKKVKIPKCSIASIAIENSSRKGPYQDFDTLFEMHKEYTAKSFDYPVGKPDGKGYYNAQKFTKNNHLGDDWNGVGGGNSDLGDPIYSIANGYVTAAEDLDGGWGKVIRIVHLFKGKYYESIYAHCQTMTVQKDTWVKKGVPIATIGNADGIYLAHLHLEIRDTLFMEIGPGYSNDTRGYLDPTLFINKN